MPRFLLGLTFLLISGSAAAQTAEQVDVHAVGLRFAKMAIIAERMYSEARRANDPALFRLATTYTGYVAGNLRAMHDHLNPEALEKAEGISLVLRRLGEPGANNTPAGVTAAAIISNDIDWFVEHIYTTGIE